MSHMHAHVPTNVINRLHLFKKYDSMRINNLFKAVLLIVDISGFTKLSTKVRLNDLQNIVNTYFSSILHIIYAHEGEVLKFAGDAIFVTWNVKFQDESLVVTRAINCALDISYNCDNCKIAPSFDSASWIEGSGKSQVLEDYIYLNVHSGLAISNLAGLEVQSDKRREYFVIGDAVDQATNCLEIAKAGCLVITSECDRLFDDSLIHVKCDYKRDFLESGNAVYSLLFDVEFKIRETSIRSLNAFIRSCDMKIKTDFELDAELLNENPIVQEYVHEAIRINYQVVEEVFPTSELSSFSIDSELRDIATLFINLKIDSDFLRMTSIDRSNYNFERFVKEISNILQDCFVICNKVLTDIDSNPFLHSYVIL